MVSAARTPLHYEFLNPLFAYVDFGDESFLAQGSDDGDLPDHIEEGGIAIDNKLSWIQYRCRGYYLVASRP